MKVLSLDEIESTAHAWPEGSLGEALLHTAREYHRLRLVLEFLNNAEKFSPASSYAREALKESEGE